MTEPSTDATEVTSTMLPWSASRRFWVSVALLFHLFCVTLAPLAVVDPRPAVAVAIQGWLQPYSESLYLIHGYRFFAPEPGPSHILHYQITQNSGDIIEGRFPDPQQHWPRLLYHRWFMLSETVFQHVSATLSLSELDRWRTEIQQQIESLKASDPRASEQFGKKEDPQKFSCPECHQPIPVDAQFCHQCGHQQLVFNQCGGCNKNLTPSAKFCPRCGKSVEDKPQIKSCPTCGNDNLADSMYCNECGEKL